MTRTNCTQTQTEKNEMKIYFKFREHAANNSQIKKDILEILTGALREQLKKQPPAI